MDGRLYPAYTYRIYTRTHTNIHALHTLSYTHTYTHTPTDNVHPNLHTYPHRTNMHGEEIERQRPRGKERLRRGWREEKRDRRPTFSTSHME